MSKIAPLLKTDRNKMIEKLKNFPYQIEEAAEIANEQKVPKLKFNNIIVTGIGGSAIGGELIASWAFYELGINIFVNQNYTLPKFADKESLVFAVSYSGNTEETISAFLDGVKRNCTLICITSGGKLKYLAEQHNKIILKIPPGYQPREAIGYLSIPIGVILAQQGVFKLKLKSHLDNAVAVLRNLTSKLMPENDNNKNIAYQYALKIRIKNPIIYAYSYLIPVAKRWKCQLNENSKKIAFVSCFPEITHNEVEALEYDKASSHFLPVLLRSRDEHRELKLKIERTKRYIFKGGRFIELYGYGSTKLAQMLSLLYIGDFVSYYLALLQNIDPTPIRAIERLKKSS